MRCSGSGQEELATTTTREVDRTADEIQGAQPPAANHLIQGRLTYDCRVTTPSPHHASVLDGVARRLGGRQAARPRCWPGNLAWPARYLLPQPFCSLADDRRCGLPIQAAAHTLHAGSVLRAYATCCRCGHVATSRTTQVMRGRVPGLRTYGYIARRASICLGTSMEFEWKPDVRVAGSDSFSTFSSFAPV